MEKVVLILEAIFFGIASIILITEFVFHIVGRIRAKKEDEMINQMFNDIITAIRKKEEEKSQVKKSKKETNTTKSKYDDMNILELRQIAQKKKIKGYYTMKKKELLETLKETV